MSQVFEVDPRGSVDVGDALGAALQAVHNRELVVFPTDTVYGIGCLPQDPDSTRRLFEAKRRPSGLTLPVLGASATEVLDLGAPTETARRLADAFWPGPLTMVLPRAERSRNWFLGQATDTIGLRVPDHAFCLTLLAITGPLAATSANISGRPPLQDLAGLEEAFGDAVAVYVVVRAGAKAPSGQPSTVVDVTGPEPRVLRLGPIDEARLSSTIRGSRRARTGRPRP